MQKIRFKPFKRRANAKSFHSPPIFIPISGNYSSKSPIYAVNPPAKIVYFVRAPIIRSKHNNAFHAIAGIHTFHFRTYYH
jgi:hypothetical protein